ncbi:MAG: aldo/keto reductase [Firmicutes bacterium]|nr:aldo/keto reductase [Bacillota bacterium]
MWRALNVTDGGKKATYSRFFHPDAENFVIKRDVLLQMKYNNLGKTGLTVSELCLGLLPMGPLQADISKNKSMEIIKYALAGGINFFDTAEMYRTQVYLGEVLRNVRSQVVIATKSTASSYDGMAEAVERSLQELSTDYIDIYHLHAARPGREVFTDRSEALRCLHHYKHQGVIRAVGLATHNRETVEAAVVRDDIDVVFALINKQGFGLINGTVKEMTQSMARAAASGKGVYAMKALAGGNLISQFTAAINFVRALEGVSALAVGMVSEQEVRNNIRLFSGQEIEEPQTKDKRIRIYSFVCEGCSACVEACHSDAIKLVEGKAQVDHHKCLLCGYCGSVCPVFAIRVS